MPDHPDHEQLAAFQAGDVDRRERPDVEAHLAGCPSCAELVASVGRARGSLALLEEPDLPPGLHDRLAAAVAAEAEAAADPGPRVTGRAGSRRGDRPGARREARPGGPVLRPAPWYRRPVAWGAAAALLLAALVVPFLNQSAATSTPPPVGASATQEPPRPAAPARPPPPLPVFRVRARSRRTRSAPPRHRPPGQGRPRQRRRQHPPGRGPGRTHLPSQRPTPSANAPRLQSCLPAATAAADPATRPLAPAFFIEGTYQGRAATILVTTSTPQPGRVDLWVFPRDDCTSPPLATERVRYRPSAARRHAAPLPCPPRPRERYQAPLARANATPPLST